MLYIRTFFKGFIVALTGLFFLVGCSKRDRGGRSFPVSGITSWGLTNNDQILKGRNRFYRYEDVAASCLSWFNYAFVIAQKGQALDPNAVYRADPSTIVHAKGF